MAINLKIPEKKELRPRITVLGVGGAGGNAVNNMIAAKLEGVDFVVANTDAQALSQSRASRRIQLGVELTEGLGAGANPEVGRAGAEESLEEILDEIAGSHMVFIAAGMGGGTGTGAAPVIARAVRERGILVVGVVTKPFAMEGARRMRAAETGIEELQAFVHTLIVIPNQNLFRVTNERTPMPQALAMADEVLHQGVRGLTDLIMMPGLINLDFADIKSVISEMGKAMMGTGEAEGEDRALKAADLAISNPLLDEVTMKGAKAVLINITGGPDLMLFEVEQAANRIRAEVDPDANIIFGNTILDHMEGRIRVSVVATGIDAEMMELPGKVRPIRPNLKPLVFQPEPKPFKDAGNPVRDQVEAIASGIGAEPQPEISETESYILDDAGASDVEDEAPVIAAPEMPPLPARAPEAKRRWGFFGGNKAKKDMRAELPPKFVEPKFVASQPEPKSAEPRVVIPRAPTSRDPAEIVPHPQSDAPRIGADDLFPDHKRDEEFEIPAFLRRQSN